MIPDGYRMYVAYDTEKKKFVVRIPELGNLTAEGETRSEALVQAEEKLEQAFRQAAEDGSEMPAPLDGNEYSGEFMIKVSPSLHRELAFIAAREGLELNQIAKEALSIGTTIRFQEDSGRINRDARQINGKERDNRRSHRGSKYFNIMDDRANFIDYVRNLDSGGGRGNRRGGKNRGGRKY